MKVTALKYMKTNRFILNRHCSIDTFMHFIYRIINFIWLYIIYFYIQGIKCYWTIYNNNKLYNMIWLLEFQFFKNCKKNHRIINNYCLGENVLKQWRVFVQRFNSQNSEKQNNTISQYSTACFWVLTTKQFLTVFYASFYLYNTAYWFWFWLFAFCTRLVFFT